MILDIQSALKGMRSVSLPWIQSKYELGYQDAKLFLAQLITRGWVKKDPDGIAYEIVQENLCLRRIQRSEVEDLIEDLTPDCISALQCMQKRQATGADFGDLSSAIHSDDDTKEALDVLLAHTLCYCADGVYFICVSPKTVRVLAAVIRKKSYLQSSRRFDGEETDLDIEGLIKLFDELFAKNV